MAEQTDGPNHHAFGTFGTSAAEQPLVPKASGDRSSGTFGKNNMRRLLLTAIILVTVVSVYVLSYRFSYLRQARTGDNSSWQLVVAGIPLPYNDATRQTFSLLYRPLIEQSAAKRPGDDIKGKIQRIDLSASELLVAREGKDGILIQIPSTMKNRLQDFSSGDTIHLTYRYRAMKDDPFCYSYELKTINHIATSGHLKVHHFWGVKTGSD